jgi:hypothetical protein
MWEVFERTFNVCVSGDLYVSSTGNGTWVNRVVYCATGTEIYISAG